MEHLAAIGTYIQSNILAILVAVIASFVVGFIWHGPLFGKKWMEYNNMKKPDTVKFSDMVPGIVASVVMAFVQAAILGRAFELVSLTGIGQALLIGAIISIPFTGLAIVNHYAWEGKKPGHMLLDGSYNLASTLAIAAVLYSMA